MDFWPYLTAAALLFAETGFLVGLFVPGGDTLLLALGMLAGEGGLRLELLLPTLFLASLAGHNLGYFWGRRLGPRLVERVPRQYVDRVERLHGRFGARLVVVSPLLPVLRTFTPFVMGAMRMPWPRYFWLSVLGSLVWTQGLTLLGYFLGRALPHWAVLALVFAFLALALIPPVLRAWREARQARAATAEGNPL